jgi:ParB family chromosome partitioning protein
MATRKPRRKKVEPSSRGLDAAAMGETPPSSFRLSAEVEADGGKALGAYRDPLAGEWLLLAALPIEQVAPTPFQRDVSEAHLKRLVDVIDKVGLFLDPIIATREAPRQYLTPNGSHRLHALRKLGAKAVTALVVPNKEVAYKILALNTEKAHNLKEKALEVIRMARALAEDTDKTEADFALEFEEPVLLTLGPCYEKNGRFSGGAYRPALVRVETFLAEPLPKALTRREARAASLLEIDERVTEIIAALKERGFTSPYLRPFVTARINPLRFKKETSATPEEVLAKMAAAAEKFDVGKVKADEVNKAGGYGGGEDA